jgi:outer membrane protein assembly factor BamB
MRRTLRPLLHPFQLLVITLALAAAPALGGDWPEWRGPRRDGTSDEKNLPEKWAPNGENFNWRAPYGGRSAPIVLGDRVCIQNYSGAGATRQERVMCFDADSGRLLWEYKFNVFLSDVPPHRVGWASPAGDPATGILYVYGVHGILLALDGDGKLLWERSLGEDFGLITTHGGRTVSPVIEGDLVIVSGLNAGWGAQARGGHRFFAFDKKTGATVWVSSPGRQPYDTTYSPPIAAEINGTRLLIAGAGDGAVHALKPQTGEPVWRYEISKRGINTGAVVVGTNAFVSHGEENLDTSVMGLIASVDAGATGELGAANVRWKEEGPLLGYSSPVTDGRRVYQIDNGSNLLAFDAVSGKQMWTLNLGTIQRASPVLADGKLYVGNENGRFYILRPREDGCDILSRQQLGTEAEPEMITGSAAISRGRVFFVTHDALYSFGRKNAAAPNSPVYVPAKGDGPPASVQVVPAEFVLKPGESIELRARLFDARGRFLRESPARWTLEGVRGTVSESGRFTAATDPVGQAGEVKAAIGELSGAARVRILPPMPLREDFEALAPNSVPRHWINAAGKYQVREEAGNKILAKLADNAATKRARTFFGPSDWKNYTVMADVRATQRRRQMGDAGVVAQRHALILFGNHQRLELQSWQPETERTVQKEFPWKPDTWYRIKLEVQNLPDGSVRARGKVWPVSEPEPDAWTIERTDPLGNRQGSPGIYADAPFEIYFDNVMVIPNR